VWNATTGRNGSGGFQFVWHENQVFAGSLVTYFGKVPPGTLYSDRVPHRPDEVFTNIFVRFYVKHSANFQGYVAKLTRVRVEAQQGAGAYEAFPAAINHVLGSTITPSPRLTLTSYSNVESGGTALVAEEYNPWAVMQNIADTRTYANLGNWEGTANVFDRAKFEWVCIEYQTKLNTPGNNDGESRVWVDDVLDQEKTGQNFVENFTTYGINSASAESYWNAGSPNPDLQTRVFDNYVVSTERIACSGEGI
jgi:hypothetical protein